eukprot:TRINITY_DN8996_c0_g1_i2.p1 TRINITY_DN8996_c0_g1~~TRINITY_DN8996_c0_g1_i2.p1  ORF type:complete len:205 (-),score=-27.12 TRINITY_DN8996_c0_g1_i2:145-759(-)
MYICIDSQRFFGYTYTCIHVCMYVLCMCIVHNRFFRAVYILRRYIQLYISPTYIKCVKQDLSTKEYINSTFILFFKLILFFFCGRIGLFIKIVQLFFLNNIILYYTKNVTFICNFQEQQMYTMIQNEFMRAQISKNIHIKKILIKYQIYITTCIMKYRTYDIQNNAYITNIRSQQYKPFLTYILRPLIGGFNQHPKNISYHIRN